MAIEHAKPGQAIDLAAHFADAKTTALVKTDDFEVIRVALEAGGKLLMTNEAGKTSILEAGPKFVLLAENDLKESTLGTPAVLGGQIFFRTRSRLICIGEAASK